MDLRNFFKENPKCALGFSGGVDSAYLLYAGKAAGADIQPYYIKTAFQPQFEYDDAVRLCTKLNIKLKTVEYDILSCDNIAANPENRCYYCKRALFAKLTQAAQSDGYDLIIDGTNASDDADDRPGMRALKEMSVRSPLRECGLTKSKIRELSKKAELFTWDKPAYACLATRIPHGTKITADMLERVERAESELMSMGFSDFRVRVFGGAARIQIKEEQFAKAAAAHSEISRRLNPYFGNIFLDTETR